MGLPKCRKGEKLEKLKERALKQIGWARNSLNEMQTAFEKKPDENRENLSEVNQALLFLKSAEIRISELLKETKPIPLTRP